MKKILFFLIFSMLSAGLIFAGTTKTLSENPVLVDWEFSPEVSTDMGFNLDSQVFGLKGAAKLSLTSTIHKKADYVLTGEGTTYGTITIKDLEIKVNVDGQKSDYDSTATTTKDNVVSGTVTNGTLSTTNASSSNLTTQTNKQVLVIKYGKIEGVIHFGPMFALQLATKSHDDVNISKTLDDGDLDFSNIGYDVIPAYYSGSFSGARTTGLGATNLQLTTSKNIGGEVLTDEENASDGVKNNLGGATFKITVPNMVNIDLGFSTKYSFLQNVTGNEQINPIAFSFSAELKAIENLIFKFKLAAAHGNNGNGLMEKDNPMYSGLLVGYGLKIGENTLTPKLGLEIKSVKDNKISGNSSTEMIDVNPIEIMFGATYDWKTKGHSANEDGHLSMAQGDIKVTDGVSLGTVLGSNPLKYNNVTYNDPDSQVSYLGAKLAFWDTEATDKPGLLKGLQVGLVFNFNYVLGKEYDTIAGGSVPAGKLTLPSVMDMGVGLEASYAIQFVKPFLGLVYKSFNMTDEKLKFAVGSNSTEIDLDYFNKDDFRLKLGVELTKLVANTTFTMQWQSGNLLNEGSNTNASSYNEKNYFENILVNNATAPDKETTKPADYLSAKMGYISIGAKISF